MINLEKFAELVKDTELDFLDTQYANECGDENELQEWIMERISEQGIIYYSTAMDYLMEHDASLRDSLELAIEYGFEVKNLNSETLATLLYQQKLSDALAELDLSECFGK